MPHVSKPLITVLVVPVAAGCGGGEGQAGAPHPINPDAATTANATASANVATTGASTVPEGTMAVASDRATQASGARVETCDGDKLYLNAAEKRLLELQVRRVRRTAVPRTQEKL